MAATIAIVDYGMGNLRSVAKALEHVAPAGTDIRVTSDPAVVRRADRVVFPGQGAAADCMRALRETGLDEAIVEAVRSRPFLGVCMGMQVLLESSEENDGTPCLGVFPGRVRYFGTALDALPEGRALKIPHMGWNTIHQSGPHPLWAGIPQDSHFYFVHSYYADPADDALCLGSTEYGISFTSVLGRDNVFAIQSHPEKSAQAGVRLLENFARWDGEVP
jgi:glutamine amidotransferase